MEDNKTANSITREQWLAIYRNDELIQKYRELGDVENHNERLRELARIHNYKIPE
jgi:hypothetical protein